MKAERQPADALGARGGDSWALSLAATQKDSEQGGLVSRWLASDRHAAGGHSSFQGAGGRLLPQQLAIH